MGPRLEAEGERTVIHRGLAIMVAFTEALPVAAVPEQLQVAAVWHSVIGYVCLYKFMLLQALHAPRMLGEVPFAFATPSISVELCFRTPAIVLVLLPVPAVFGAQPADDDPPAAWMRARLQWRNRHIF